MNRASPEMLHCLTSSVNLAGDGTEMSVLDRQRPWVKWQQEQFNGQQILNGGDFSLFSQAPEFENLGSNQLGFGIKPDPDLDNGWSELGQFYGSTPDCWSGGLGVGAASEMGCGISRTASCPVAALVGEEEKQRLDSASGKKMMMVGGEGCGHGGGGGGGGGGVGLKKRKVDRSQSLKMVAEEGCRGKKMKACSDKSNFKITKQNNDDNNNNNDKKENSANNSKDNSKISEVQKPDYIHVRARRGQATDSHSLAERVRREKISERMKYLQDLVPGCNKITGKAGMLDEIINYVQSLQRQVEFLSMKLASANRTLDFNTASFSGEEVFPACTPDFSVGVSSEITLPTFFQFDPLGQVGTCNGLEMRSNPADYALRRTISAPVSNPESFLDFAVFNQMQAPPNWDANLQSLNSYGVECLQGRSTSFPPHQFAGDNEASNVKMEMM